jgi:hypothetical protein
LPGLVIASTGIWKLQGHGRPSIEIASDRCSRASSTFREERGGPHSINHDAARMRSDIATVLMLMLAGP